MSKKVTIVKEHPRHVNVSPKNPTGITIVDRHPRTYDGVSLSKKDIERIYNEHAKSIIKYPASKKLTKYKNADKYDEYIAVWTDYFNKIFNLKAPIDPDVVKALIASESDFLANPKNTKAIGITQITKETLEILQSPHGEAKDFIFKDIRQKDLKDPTVAIPMGMDCTPLVGGISGKLHDRINAVFC